MQIDTPVNTTRPKPSNSTLHSDDLLDQGLVDILNSDGVAVIPTDTIYGIVGRYDSPKAVQKIRRLKNRGSDQAFIVLCANIDQIRTFGVEEAHLKQADTHWPGKVSVILNTLHHWPDISGKLEGIGFRVPDNKELRSLLLQTGPLVAPSANPKNDTPAWGIKQAEEYFGDKIGAYINYGLIKNTKPSKLLKISPDGTEDVLRA